MVGMNTNHEQALRAAQTRLLAARTRTQHATDARADAILAALDAGVTRYRVAQILRISPSSLGGILDRLARS